MYDVNFFMKAHPIRERLSQGEIIQKEEVNGLFESYRSVDPIIYNIETTNACNMRCKMCPRTTRMTRSIKFLDLEFYEQLVTQISPHRNELWEQWEQFCTEVYGIAPDSKPSENHFFLYIIPKVIQLHGYGDPLLDKNLAGVIKILTTNGFQSYFSCNPANIDLEKTDEMMASGLDYLKYSFESTVDNEFKDIRGNAANFSEAYEKTLQVYELKKKNNYATTIIITMIDINRSNQQQEFENLVTAFESIDTYIYLKSEDQQWYREDDSLNEYLAKRGRELPSGSAHGTKAIHWLEICKHPWMSMTIKSDGAVAMCMEDYNNEIVLGNAHTNSLKEIWNGELYQSFRQDHFNQSPCIKCTEECDMPKIGMYFK